jgi:MFS family permease
VPSRRAGIRLPGSVIALGFASLFGDVASEMIFPLLPVFVPTLGGGAAFLGLVEGVADAVSAFLKLATGWLSDRTGRQKPFVLAGYALAGVVRPLMGLAQAPWHVLAIRSTDRVGKGERTTPRDALIAAHVTPETSGRAFGFHRSMDHLGAVLGPLAATGLLALGLSMRTVFLAAVVPGLLAVVAVLFAKEADAAPTRGESPTSGRGRLPRRLVGFYVILAAFSVVNASDVFLLLRAKEMGVGTTWLPVLWAVHHVSKSACTYVGGTLSDRIPRATMIAAGWGVYAVLFVAFAFAEAGWQVWALFALMGVYFGLTEPVEKALVRDLAPASMRGRAFGLYNFVLGACAVPAGLLMGHLWETYSSFVALATGSAVAAASAVALIVWSRASGAGARPSPPT